MTYYELFFQIKLLPHLISCSGGEPELLRIYSIINYFPIFLKKLLSKQPFPRCFPTADKLCTKYMYQLLHHELIYFCENAVMMVSHLYTMRMGYPTRYFHIPGQQHCPAAVKHCMGMNYVVRVLFH